MQPQFHNQYVPPRPVQNSQQDSVVKFLLKLRNNNLNNLKNALRKVGERTHGKKDELLLRLANKLATPEGKDLVKANFKPEIYKDLYEVEIMGDSAANVANPIYQHYRGMIPAGF
jgi:thermostable 8-oxoguanine DNA glycosylase